MFVHVDVTSYTKTRIPSFSVVIFFKYDVKTVCVIQRWASKPFLSQQIANPQIFGFIPLSKIRKFLRCPSSQIANPQIFMINPQIENPQILTTKYCTTLSHISPKFVY